MVLIKIGAKEAQRHLVNIVAADALDRRFGTMIVTRGWLKPASRPSPFPGIQYQPNLIGSLHSSHGQQSQTKPTVRPSPLVGTTYRWFTQTR